MPRIALAVKIVLYALTALLGLAVIVTTPLLPIVGVTPMVVVSGSMEPTIHVGEEVFVRKVDPSTYKVGDVATYKTTNSFTTHRITDIESTPDGRAFRLQGDANATKDPETIEASRIQGVVAFHLPLMGYLVNFVGSPLGRLLALLFVAVGLLEKLAKGQPLIPTTPQPASKP